MIATPDIEQMIGAEAVDPNNDKIGKVSQVYVDADTDQPTWASVRTGLFGLSETLVPLTNASWDHDTLHVDVEKARVKDAPRVDPEAEISTEEQERLYAYYGMNAGSAAAADERGTGGPIGAGQVGMDAGAIGTDASMQGRHAGTGTARNDTDADRVDGYDAATMSDTGYGAGAGAAGAGAPGRAGAGLAGTGVGRAPADRGGYDDRPAGPRFDRGQSAEADGREVDDNAGYGLTNDEPGGPDVRGSGRTAGDGQGSGDFASTGTALENENPVAEEAAEGTGSGYGTSEDEDISGRFVDGRGERGRDHGGRDRDEMREAGAMPTAARNDDLGGRGMPGMAGGMAGAASDAGADGTQSTAGMQRQSGGGMRLRRYVIRQETVVEPLNEQDELRMQPGSASSMEAPSGVRMDDQDPNGR